MGQDYVVGNMSADADAAERGGWFLGSFFDRADGRHSADIEAKYWTFEPGTESAHSAKTSTTIEFTLILDGHVEAELGDQTVPLRAGDYVLIHPGTANNLVARVVSTVTALTVKSPSDPSAKTVLSN